MNTHEQHLIMVLKDLINIEEGLVAFAEECLRSIFWMDREQERALYLFRENFDARHLNGFFCPTLRDIREKIQKDRDFKEKLEKEKQN